MAHVCFQGSDTRCGPPIARSAAWCQVATMLETRFWHVVSSPPMFKVDEGGWTNFSPLWNNQVGLDNPSCSYKTAWPVNISTKRKGLTFFSIHFFSASILGLFFSIHFWDFFSASIFGTFFQLPFWEFFSAFMLDFFPHPLWDFFQLPFWEFFSASILGFLSASILGIFQHPFWDFAASILGASILGLFSPNHGYNMTEQGPLKKDQVQPWTTGCKNSIRTNI